MILIPQSIHGLPKAVMDISAELTITGEAFQRSAFPKGLVPGDALQHLLFEDEKSAVDISAIAGRLLGKTGDAIAVEHRRTEAAGRQHGGQGRVEPLAVVKFHQGA